MVSTTIYKTEKCWSCLEKTCYYILAFINNQIWEGLPLSLKMYKFEVVVPQRFWETEERNLYSVVKYLEKADLTSKKTYTDMVFVFEDSATSYLFFNWKFKFDKTTCKLVKCADRLHYMCTQKNNDTTNDMIIENHQLMWHTKWQTFQMM